MDACRTLLLQAGFAEATKNPTYFWKILTEKTAFIVNLKAICSGIGVVYGVTSTAALSTALASWEYFKEMGERDSEISLRFYGEIQSQQDAQQVCGAIQTLYNEFLHMDKDALLAVVKEKRKQFIAQITNVLKPLGFRKKGNQWRKTIEENYILQFWADKSLYCDLYYFQVNVYASASPVGFGCYNKRLDTTATTVFDWKEYSEAHRRFDWQLQSAQQLQQILQTAYEKELRPFLDCGIAQMGKEPNVWSHCVCSRNRCSFCWVEKNLWEAKGASENTTA